MPDDNLSEILRTVELRPKEIGSHRITSDQLRAFLKDLEGIVSTFSGFIVWRFGHRDSDRLEYSVFRVPEAIDHYDVRQIYGSGYLTEEKLGQPFIEIDLRDGGHFYQWDWLCRLSGPKPQVDAAMAIIWEHVDRWQPTWHQWFHRGYWFVGWLLLYPWLNEMSSFLKSPNSDTAIYWAALTYLLCFTTLVLLGAHQLAPFIWFYRPGSRIEARRQWLPRLSVGAGIALAGEVMGNFVSNLLNK